MTKEFRCAFFAPEYEKTVEFYKRSLGFQVIDSWDNQGDRGTLFAAASGIIEVMALPRHPEPESIWDHRPPQGLIFVIEVPDVEEFCRTLESREVSLLQGLRTQPWGHRSVVIQDPNGVRLYFYSLLAARS